MELLSKNKENIFLITILLLATLLRLWNLGSIPPGLTPDEASLGYNAYSILKTGRDEYGEFIPIIFKSFGDYKPGLYIYTAIPFIKIFGLNEFSVRLPSAISGIIAVWLIYKILSLFKNIKEKPDSLKIKLSAALILAVNPWHIHFSRGAWEVNLALTLTLFGIYFFLRALKNLNYLILSSVFFSLTFSAYQGAKLSTLIILIIILMLFWVEVFEFIKNNSRKVLFAFLLGVLIFLPIFTSFYKGETGRLEVFSVFSYPRKPEDIREILSQSNEGIRSFSYYLFHSERLNFLRGIMGRWFNHFSGRFLFFEGDWQNKRHSPPNSGMMLFSDIFLLLFGFIVLFKRDNIKLKHFVLLWLIFAPLPAVLSRDSVHAVRAYNMLIPLVIISSLGLYQIILSLTKFTKSRQYMFYCIIVFLLLGSFLYYFDAYFIHLVKHNSKEWEYGYKEVVETISPIQNNFEKVIIQQSFAQPYIYFLFYQKYDPVKYQMQANLIESEYKGDVGYIEKLDNICFCAIDWPQNKKEQETLVVADDIRIPEKELESESIDLIKEIKYLDGNTAFRVVEIK